MWVVSAVCSWKYFELRLSKPILSLSHIDLAGQKAVVSGSGHTFEQEELFGRVREIRMSDRRHFQVNIVPEGPSSGPFQYPYDSHTIVHGSGRVETPQICAGNKYFERVTTELEGTRVVEASSQSMREIEFQLSLT